MNPPELLTLAECAALAKVHPRTLRRAIATGQLEAYRIGRLIRIRPDDLDTYLTRKAVTLTGRN